MTFRKSGVADVALMGGGIPPWLFDRMVKLSLPIVESIIEEYGVKNFLSKMSDPFWFQSFGAVIGMDWNSSGVTTAVMRALKESINPHSRELGLFICGGKGKESKLTPKELIALSDQVGTDGRLLAKYSKTVAKVDNSAIQDGYHLYLHNFIVSSEGDWSVIQQGMNSNNGMARRYHWHSEHVESFVSDPHSAICGENRGLILNLVDQHASETQEAIVNLTKMKPASLLKEITYMNLPTYCDVKASDVDLKKLGSIMYVAQESEVQKFEELLMLQGLGPRTLQSLALVSEVIHGTPSRFEDPARFSFAHGGKNSKPFPVATKIYDETITILQNAVNRSKIGQTDKSKSIKSLHKIAQRMENGFTPSKTIEDLKAKEVRDSHLYGGRTLKGFVKSTTTKHPKQLDLFNPPK